MGAAFASSAPCWNKIIDFPPEIRRTGATEEWPSVDHLLYRPSMLFNSYAFIFAFLPLTLLVYWTLGPRLPRRASPR